MSQSHETAPASQQWTEENSATFIDTAEVFVPGRAEQIATLVGLTPGSAEDEFTVVELAAGDGTLAEALLTAFPRCHYLALDGSSVMREHLTSRLARFGDRVRVEHFEIAERAWREKLPDSLRLVVSSLCVHHLIGEAKRDLFRDMAAHLEPGGAVLIADIVEPESPRVARVFAQQYDVMVREQSQRLYGDLRGYDEFQRLEWNYFTYTYGVPDVEDIDYPSPLADQLTWMREVGLTDVDAFWMRAGHAIFGGYATQA